ncbi:branched-chain amino acid ABC transporter permease [Peredibacter starrii]|uniref:Branched-chain amino acid ABC transporter permease n=1 Tax=Peredibacter starrii TaxID=28202 RepID=A0AAX4HK48_9BACT|nr:branched-chain amino acid ABC transporter permease [Peredibacter starrii]WPU63607.1 branched-chain amino acid ABC transporter permease [Peredibacter starrii]
MAKKINTTLLLTGIFFASAIALNFVLSGFSVQLADLFYAKPGRFSGLISPYYYSVLIILGINIILSVSLALLNGFTGLFTMGHAGFMAIGAYASASVVSFLLPTAPFALQLVVGSLSAGILAAVIGLIIGSSTLRLAGDYLGMVTLGFGEIIRIILLNIDAVGGARGMTDIPVYMNLGSVFLLTIITILVIKRVRDGRLGRAMLAIKENEMAANMMGINPLSIKLKAFVLSSFMAGVAGSFFAHSEGYLSTQTFTFVKSFEVIAMNVVGGLGSLSGAIMGAGILTVLPEGLRVVQDITGIDLRMIIYALTIILIMILRPQGIMGNKEWKWLSSK